MAHTYAAGQRVRIIADGTLGTVEFGDDTGANVIEADGSTAWFVAADVEPVTPVEYTVLTPRRIVQVTSASNSISDITKAVKAAKIDPRTVIAITAVE